MIPAPGRCAPPSPVQRRPKRRKRTDAQHPKPVAQPPRTRHGTVVWGLVGLLALPLATAGAFAWSNTLGLGSQSSLKLTSAVAHRGPMAIRLTERGEMISGNNTTVRHRVEHGGGLAILKIAEEGSWVAKDDLLALLDSSRFEQNAQRYQIYAFMYEAYQKTAETALVIQEMQNESMVASAEHRLRMAELDLKKYLNADYVQRRNNLWNEIRMAEENRTTAQQGLEFSRKMLRKGYTTTVDIDADQLHVGKMQLTLDLARERLKILDEYTHKRTVAQLEANRDYYKQETDRVKLRADRASSQCRLNVLYGKRWANYYRGYYDAARRQIKACEIRAPHEGLVVHANTGSNGGSYSPLICEGAKVWEGQAIVHLPDVTNMQVNARIHESKILMVREGLPVTIHLDARAGETFHGVVEKVSVAPLSAAWPNFNLKEYATVIRITDEVDRVMTLRPGMTAEVTIHVDPLESVLQIPVQACVDRGARHFVWVLNEEREPHRREIKVRMANSEAIEVVDGLGEGDEVILNPRSDLPDEIALLEQEQRLMDDEPVAQVAETPAPMGEEEWQYLFEGGPEPKSRDDEQTTDASAGQTQSPADSLPEVPPAATR
jgi:HlyD family secretion protein